MTAMKNMGKAFADRVDGNVYHVTYQRSSAQDRDVSGSYLNELVRSGYEVVCNNNGHGGGIETGRLVNGEVVWVK